MTLYAYIMTDDNGRAPNPSYGVCTLAYCMPMTRRAAQCGDYIVGLGGAEFRERKGGWHIIYAMKVQEKIAFITHDRRFQGRAEEVDDAYRCLADSVLVSRDFAYWGSNARFLSDTPLSFLEKAFDNGSRGHRYRFTDEEEKQFTRWFNQQQKGKQGEPFDWEEDADTALCVPRHHPRRNC